jgi:tryptophanyl-tRNA synthetase
LADFGGRGFGTFKPALADLSVSVMGPIGERMRRLMADPAEIDRVLAAGAERARAVAEPVIEDTKRLVGFWPG